VNRGLDLALGTRLRRERLLLFLCAIVATVVLFGLADEPRSFSDNYILMAKRSLFDLKLYTADRPATTFLLYKLCGYEPHRIVFAQRLLSILAWLWLGFAVSRGLRREAVCLTTICLFALAPLSPQVAGWTTVLLSESLSLSLFAIWLGAYIIISASGNLRWLALLAPLTLLFSFTRDTWSYFLLFFVVLRLLQALVMRRSRTFHLVYFAVVLGIFLLQALSAQMGKRTRFPLHNVVLQRILPDKARTDWFIQTGAPLGLFKDAPHDWSGEWASSHKFALLIDPHYQPFVRWSVEDGKAVYALFLLTHPGYTLHTVLRDSDSILAGSLKDYVGETPEHWALGLATLPWELGGLALATICVFVLALIRQRLPLAPLFLCLALLGTAFVAYHGDAMEVTRHCHFLRLGLTLVAWLCLLQLADVLQFRGKSESAEPK